VELRSQLPRLGVRARSGYGTRRCARVLGGVTASCSADPCPYQSDGHCDVPDGTYFKSCAFGDYIDCLEEANLEQFSTLGAAADAVFSRDDRRLAMLLVNGTLPDTIGSLSCRSKITSMYAHPQLVTSSLSMRFLRSLPAREWALTTRQLWLFICKCCLCVRFLL
jgi:hypothetical protein